MDEAEFTRRIKVYLELDFPNVANADELAERLGQHLFRYVRRDEREHIDDSETLLSLLPEGRVLLLFSARWDGSATGYRAVVENVAQDLRASVIDIDIDDPLGSAIARICRIEVTPSVVDVRSSGTPIVGSRTAEELLAALDRR